VKRLRRSSILRTAWLLLLAHSLAWSDAASWLDVPFVQQAEDGCGAASVAMIMQYWARLEPHADAAAADGDRIYRLLSSPGGNGISGQALKRYLEQHGFSAFVIDGELRDLRQHLEKGRPLIVCTAPRGRHAPLHYAVVVGISDVELVLNDPARGKLIRENLDHFLHTWKATGNWTLLAVPRS
jgi:predicted double-glycine peptidase